MNYLKFLNDIQFFLSVVIVMFISVVVVTMLGTMASDGFVNIFEKAAEGNRIVLSKYEIIQNLFYAPRVFEYKIYYVFSLFLLTVLTHRFMNDILFGV